MEEERFVACAQVIQARLTIGCLDEAVLGALAVTGEAYFALSTVAQQRVALVHPKLPLLVRRHQLDHVFLLDVAQQVFRLDKVSLAGFPAIPMRLPDSVFVLSR